MLGKDRREYKEEKMLKVSGSTLATILWALEQEGVTEEELLCLSVPRCKKRIARTLRDFRNAQLLQQGESDGVKISLVDHTGNVTQGVGSVVDVDGVLHKVIGAKMRTINLESYALDEYEEGEVPSWISEAIDSRGEYVPPEGHNFKCYVWAVGKNDCYTALILRRLP